MKLIVKYALVGVPVAPDGTYTQENLMEVVIATSETMESFEDAFQNGMSTHISLRLVKAVEILAWEAPKGSDPSWREQSVAMFKRAKLTPSAKSKTIQGILDKHFKLEE